MVILHPNSRDIRKPTSYELFIKWKLSYKIPMNWTERRQCVCMRLLRKHSRASVSHTPCTAEPCSATHHTEPPGFSIFDINQRHFLKSISLFYLCAVWVDPFFSEAKTHLTLLSRCPLVHFILRWSLGSWDWGELGLKAFTITPLSLSKACLKSAPPISTDSLSLSLAPVIQA